MSEPLWSDERLIARAEAIAASWHRVLDREQIYLLRGQILGLLREVHDPLSVTLQACEDELFDAKARIAELEAQLAQLAQAWQPVNEKFILTYDTGLVDTPKQFVRWNADDESVLVGKDDGSFYHCPLPDNIRLCRLVTKEPTP